MLPLSEFHNILIFFFVRRGPASSGSTENGIRENGIRENGIWENGIREPAEMKNLNYAEHYSGIMSSIRNTPNTCGSLGYSDARSSQRKAASGETDLEAMHVCSTSAVQTHQPLRGRSAQHEDPSPASSPRRPIKRVFVSDLRSREDDPSPRRPIKRVFCSLNDLRSLEDAPSPAPPPRRIIKRVIVSDLTDPEVVDDEYCTVSSRSLAMPPFRNDRVQVCGGISPAYAAHLKQIQQLFSYLPTETPIVGRLWREMLHSLGFEESEGFLRPFYNPYVCREDPTNGRINMPAFLGWAATHMHLDPATGKPIDPITTHNSIRAELYAEEFLEKYMSPAKTLEEALFDGGMQIFSGRDSQPHLIIGILKNNFSEPLLHEYPQYAVRYVFCVFFSDSANINGKQLLLYVVRPSRTTSHALYTSTNQLVDKSDSLSTLFFKVAKHAWEAFGSTATISWRPLRTDGNRPN